LGQKRINFGVVKNNVRYLNLESSNIVSFNRNSLVGLKNLEKVCLFKNPISSLFPESLTSICNGNSKCKVFINSFC
jgi:hypothetical protein